MRKSKSSSSSPSSDVQVRRKALDMALTRLCQSTASALLDAVSSPNSSMLLPPLVACVDGARHEARDAMLAMLLRETLRSSATIHSGVLDLSGCGVVAADFTRITDVILLCPFVSRLSLLETLIDVPLLKALVECLSRCLHVCEVDLDAPIGGFVEITAADVEHTAEAVTNSTLQHHHEALNKRKIGVLLHQVRQLCSNNREAHKLVVAKAAAKEAEAMAVAHYKQLLHDLEALAREETQLRHQKCSQQELTRQKITVEASRATHQIQQILRKRILVAAHHQRMDSLTQEETKERELIEGVGLLEIILLLEADCGFQRLFSTREEERQRSGFKKDERSAWVLARRAEKARWAIEKQEREAFEVEETAARVEVDAELEQSLRRLTIAGSQSLEQAKDAEDARVEKIRREEAARKRLEDLARERAEKEEAQRQKALREFLHKQQLAREKMEADAAAVRKSIRHLESLQSGALFRIAALWLPYVQCRVDLEKAASSYTKLLQEPPLVQLKLPHTYAAAATAGDDDAEQDHLQSSKNGVNRGGEDERPVKVKPLPHIFVTEYSSEWLHVLGPSNFSASHLNPHLQQQHSPRDHFSGLALGSNSTNMSPFGTSLLLKSVNPPGEGSPGAAASADAGVSLSTEPSPTHANHQGSSPDLSIFTVAMRDAWLQSTKQAQQEFRSRLTKYDAAKQLTRTRITDELKTLRNAVQQFRVEFSKLIWHSNTGVSATAAASGGGGSAHHTHGAGGGNASPAGSKTGSGGAGFSQPSSALTAVASMAIEPFAAPAPVPDPLVLPRPESNSKPTSALFFSAEEILHVLVGFGNHHAYLTGTIVVHLDDETNIRSPPMDEGCVVASPAKEPSVAQLKGVKESLQEINIDVSITAGGGEGDGSQRGMLRFSLPVDGDIVWSSSAAEPVKLFENVLAVGHLGGSSSKASSHKFVHYHQQQQQRSHVWPFSRHTNAEATASLPQTIAALARQRRGEVETSTDLQREAGVPNDALDYAAVTAAKSSYEFWNTQKVISVLNEVFTPPIACQCSSDRSVEDDDEESNVARVSADLFERLSSLCEYNNTVTQVTLRYLHDGVNSTPTPQSVKSPPVIGSVATSPTTNTAPDASSEMLLPNALAATAVGGDPSTGLGLAVTGGGGDNQEASQRPSASVMDTAHKNERILEDVSQFLNSLHFFATSSCREGACAINISVTYRIAVDMARHSCSFYVLRNLLQAKQVTSSSSLIEVEGSHRACVPVVVIHPRAPPSYNKHLSLAPRTASSPQPVVVLTKSDLCSILKPHSSSFQVQPPLLFPSTTTTGDAPFDGIVPPALVLSKSALTEDDPAAAAATSMILDPTLGSSDTNLLGFELTIVSTLLSSGGATKVTAMDLSLCFTCDTKFWISVPDTNLAKKDRSPFGSIFYSPSGDGQHGVVILDILSGMISPCGNPPLSLHMHSMAAAAKKVLATSRKMSNLVSSARRLTTPGGSHRSLLPETRSSTQLRVESKVVTPSVLAEVFARFAVAVGSSSAFSTSTIASSIPVPRGAMTPRSASDLVTGANNVSGSSLFRVEVFVRPPHQQQLQHHHQRHHSVASPRTAGGPLPSARGEADDVHPSSVANTPREEMGLPQSGGGSGFAPHPLHFSPLVVTCPRVYRSDVPALSAVVEVLPPLPALPSAAVPESGGASPRGASAINPTNTQTCHPLGAYLQRHHEVVTHVVDIPAAADRGRGPTRTPLGDSPADFGGSPLRIHPFRDVALRVQLPPETCVNGTCIPLDPRIVWSLAFSVCMDGDEDHPTTGATTPLATSRLPTPNVTARAPPAATAAMLSARGGGGAGGDGAVPAKSPSHTIAADHTYSSSSGSHFVVAALHVPSPFVVEFSTSMVGSLFATIGESSQIRFIHVNASTIKAMARSLMTPHETEALDVAAAADTPPTSVPDSDEVSTIPLAIVKSEDLTTFMSIEVSFRQLHEYLTAHRSAFPSHLGVLRNLTPMLLDALVKHVGIIARVHPSVVASMATSQPKREAPAPPTAADVDDIGGDEVFSSTASSTNSTAMSPATADEGAEVAASPACSPSADVESPAHVSPGGRTVFFEIELRFRLEEEVKDVKGKGGKKSKAGGGAAAAAASAVVAASISGDSASPPPPSTILMPRSLAAGIHIQFPQSDFDANPVMIVSLGPAAQDASATEAPQKIIIDGKLIGGYTNYSIHQSKTATTNSKQGRSTTIVALASVHTAAEAWSLKQLFQGETEKDTTTTASQQQLQQTKLRTWPKVWLPERPPLRMGSSSDDEEGRNNNNGADDKEGTPRRSSTVQFGSL